MARRNGVVGLGVKQEQEQRSGYEKAILRLPYRG
jgi:ribosomal protein S5